MRSKKVERHFQFSAGVHAEVGTTSAHPGITQVSGAQAETPCSTGEFFFLFRHEIFPYALSILISY